MHLTPSHLSVLVLVAGVVVSFCCAMVSADFSMMRELLDQALECWRSGDFQSVTEVLERLCRIDPNNPKTLIELGLAYALNYNFTAAEKNFEKAIAVAPSKSDALMKVGLNWRRLRRYAAAENCFHRILQEPAAPLSVYVRLAEIYERQRRLDQAAEVVEQALKINPEQTDALFMRGQILRQKKELAAAEELFRSVISSDKARDFHSSAWYELATIFDQQGRYDDAMTAFVEGKKLMRSEAAKSSLQLQARQAALKQMREKITPEMLKRWRDTGVSQLQPARQVALLCGHARSGTTLLEYVLDSHPKIVSADETFVFSNKMHYLLSRARSPIPPILPTLEGLHPRVLRAARSEYMRGMESSFGEPIGDRLVIDKNPGLTQDLPAFYRVFPDAKFIMALRDPRDVCLSCFMQAAAMNADSSSWLTLEGTINNYVSVMSVWLTLKPHLPNAIEVRYEDMVENFEPTARRVLDFLGLEWDERVRRFDENARSKTVCSPTYADVTKPVYKSAVGRWRNYQKYFEPYQEKLSPFLRAFGYE